MGAQHNVRYTMKIKWRQKKFSVVFFVCHHIWSDGVSSAPTFSNNLFEGSWPVMHVKLASSSRQFSKSNIFPSGLIRAVSKCCYAEWWTPSCYTHNELEARWSVGETLLRCCYFTACAIFKCVHNVSPFCNFQVQIPEISFLFAATRWLNPKNVNISVA